MRKLLNDKECVALAEKVKSWECNQRKENKWRAKKERNYVGRVGELEINIGRIGPFGICKMIKIIHDKTLIYGSYTFDIIGKDIKFSKICELVRQNSNKKIDKGIDYARTLLKS